MYSWILTMYKIITLYTQCIVHSHVLCFRDFTHFCTILPKCQKNDDSWILHHLRSSSQKCKNGLLLCVCGGGGVIKTFFPCSYTFILRYVCAYCTSLLVCMYFIIMVVPLSFCSKFLPSLFLLLPFTIFVNIVPDIKFYCYYVHFQYILWTCTVSYSLSMLSTLKMC